MFMGEYAHNIDKKGRITIPATFRKDFKDTLVATRGMDGCLALYTEEQWAIIYEQLLKLPMTKKDARDYVRKLTGKAKRCEFDELGRILLPSNLIKHAQLTKECMIVGVANHVEIWSKERYEIQDESSDETFEDIAENLTEYLL